VYLFSSYHPTTSGQRLSHAKILVTSTFSTSFISEDIALLRKHFSVEHLILTGARSLAGGAAAIRNSDAVFCWFASTYSAAAIAVARTYGRKSLLSLGGADVAKLPELGYGIWTSAVKGRLAGYAIRHADRVIAVDQSLIEEARLRTHARLDAVECLPTGLDELFWRPEGPKEEFVLTVAAAATRTRLLVKGFDVLCEAASMAPNVRFVMLGVSPSIIDDARSSVPANVEVIGRVSREELRGWYRRAKVYCQPSLFEGLPNALIEAMLCGCIPVGTDVGGIRGVIGTAGFVVGPNDPGELSGALARALAFPETVNDQIPDAVRGRYTSARREEGLVRILGELLS
jgi:glycosyltransferase involved in cell wall biosynthesis